MRAQRSGQVITITSLAGLIGMEFCAAYAASKFALEGWAESLRFDIAPFGIETMIVEPGFFRTELLVQGSSTFPPDLNIDDYAERTERTVTAWAGMNGQQGGDPAKLAAALVTLSGSGALPLRFVAGRTRWRRSRRTRKQSKPRSTRIAICRPLWRLQASGSIAP